MDIQTHVKQLVEGYDQAKCERVEGNYFYPFELIKTIEYYTDSKYLFGQKDELGRDKPFLNRVNYRLTTAFKATPFSTKDIQLVPDGDENALRVSLLNHELHDWFKEVNYDATIDEMRWVRPKHGELIVKKVEKDGELKIEVVDLRNVVVDPTSLYRTFIEVHFMSPSELSQQKGWDTAELLSNPNARTKQMKVMEGTTDSTVDQYEVYEVYGEFPMSMIEEDGDKNDYRLYRLYICNDKILHKTELDEFPYKNLSWERINGRSIGRGVVEAGFEAQVWSNDAVLKQRDMMEHAAKIQFVTDDDNVEDNVITDYDSGSIIKIGDGKSFKMLNTVPTSLPQINNLLDMWNTQYQEVSSSFDSVTGATMPSRTPFRTMAMLNEAGASDFAEKNKAFGIFQKEIIYDWVLPNCIKKLKKGHRLLVDFSKEEMELFEEDFANYEINKFVHDEIIKGRRITMDELTQLKEVAKAKKLTRRIMEIPAGYYDDIRTKVDIITTGENIDKQAMFESLNNMLMTVAQNPQIMTDPMLSKLFSKIIDLAGVGISLPELTANINQNVDTNTTNVPGQGIGGGAQGIQPVGAGQANPQGGF